MAIVLFCLLLVAAGLELYSSWSLNKAIEKFVQSNKEKFLRELS